MVFSVYSPNIALLALTAAPGSETSTLSSVVARVPPVRTSAYVAVTGVGPGTAAAADTVMVVTGVISI